MVTWSLDQARPVLKPGRNPEVSTVVFAVFFGRKALAQDRRNARRLDLLDPLEPHFLAKLRCGHEAPTMLRAPIVLRFELLFDRVDLLELTVMGVERFDQFRA